MPATPEKHWYLSKGVVGGLISLAVIVFGLFKRPEMGQAVQAESGNISALIVGVVGIISSITAIVGRVKADSKITK